MSLSRTRLPAALAAGVLSLGLAACSSGPSKEEFIESAEQICADANSKLDGLQEPESPEQVTAVLDEAIGIADGAVNDLEGLDKPEGDAEEIDRIFLEPLRGQVEAIREFVPEVEEAVASGDLEALSNLQEPDAPDADLEAMRAYGFDDCTTFAEDDSA